MPSLQGRAEKAAAGPRGVATTTSRGRSASGETARRWPNLKKHGPAWHSRVPQEHRDTPRQQQQAATGKEQGKTRQVGSAGSSSALGGVFKPPRSECCAPAFFGESIN